MNPLVLCLVVFWLMWSIWFNRPLSTAPPSPGYFTELPDQFSDQESATEGLGVAYSATCELGAGFPFSYQSASYDSDLRLIASSFSPLKLAANLAISLLAVACIPYAFSNVKLQLSTMFAITTTVAVFLTVLHLLENSQFGFYISSNFIYLLTIVYSSPILFAIVRFIRAWGGPGECGGRSPTQAHQS